MGRRIVRDFAFSVLRCCHRSPTQLQPSLFFTVSELELDKQIWGHCLFLQVAAVSLVQYLRWGEYNVQREDAP